MPKEYEAVRDALVRSGKSLKEAKEIAGKIYNKRRGKGHGLKKEKWWTFFRF